MKNRYLSLHLHTIKSIGDSIVTIDKLIDKAKELNLNALSITNHGTMSDVFEFYDECKNNGIKPIIGCEIYAKAEEEPSNDEEVNTKKKKKVLYNHLVLIAKNKNGYKNLLKIHNYGHLQGFYYKPIVDDWVLKAYGKDIICLSACVGGAIPQMILQGTAEEDEEKQNKIIQDIENKALNYKSYFDEFYLEIQPGDFEQQKIVNEYLKMLSKKINIPLIITNDVHYIDKEDFKTHNVHVCANKSADVTKLVYPDTCYYVMTDKELKSAIKIEDDIFEECLCSIEHIVSQIEDYDIIPDSINMPKYKKLPLGYTEDSYLSKICFDKLEELKIHLKDPAEYTSRLIYELDTIKELNFSGYFLVVRDYIQHAIEQDIEVGPGRGSVCGSLVAYLAEITKVDPIRFGLLFERFLSVHRTSPPDVDSDFESEGRDDVFNYVVDTYGKECCALVSTFSLRKSKSAIKDTGRVYGIDKEVYEYVASLVPQVYYVDDEDGNSEKKTDLSIEETIELVPEFKEYSEKYPEWFNAAIKLSNIPKATSVHAAGTLISPVPLGDYIPLIRSKHDNIDATALNLTDAELAGFIKYDFLSLSTLGVIKKCKKLIGVKDIYSFVGDSFDDPKVWDLIGSKYTSGLFQIGSPTYKQRMSRLAPKTLEQLAACLALVRGPCIASKADQKYMDIVQGKDEIELIHNVYDEVTKETNGILLYQEQFMKIFYDMGFSMEESYTAMKAASKKKTEKLKKYGIGFNELAKEIDMNQKVIDRIFKILVDTGLYSFNKSHAIAYAILCYITAFLKVYYPKEFFAASLTNAFERKEPVEDLIADCRRLGISFLPVDINKSEWDFTIENNCLRIGFSAVKSVGIPAYDEIREKRPFNNLQDVVDKVVRKNLGKRALVPLICVGAFNEMYKSSLDAYEDYINNVLEEKEMSEIISIQGSKEKVSIYSSDLEFEKAFLGVSLISDPLNNFPSIGIDNIPVGRTFNIIGIYDKIKKINDKNKNQMAFADIKTGDGTLDCTIFASQYEKHKKLIKKNLVCSFKLRKQAGDKYIVNDIQPA